MDEELLASALRAYARTVNASDPIRLALWDQRGLTRGQIRLMSSLIDRDGQSAGELAGALSVRPPTITGLTDRLVKMGLIRRENDDRDRRVVRLRATDRGRDTMHEIDAATRDFFDRAFEGLGEAKVRTLVDLLNEFAETAHALGAGSTLQDAPHEDRARAAGA